MRQAWRQQRRPALGRRCLAAGHEPILIHGAGYKLSAPSFDSRYGSGAELQLHGGVRAVLSDDAPAAGSP